jgi:hypothetical protein
MNETVQVTKDNDQFITRFISNGMEYTITARPIGNVDFISLRTYLGYKPSKELAESVARYARSSKQPYKTELVNSSNYQGNILMYTRQYLDEYFSLNSGIDINNDNDIDDGLPF